MANREELAIIRGARSGDAAAQLALGKLYLFGGASLPQNPPTALYWLCRAASLGQEQAWQLIGGYISPDVALPAWSHARPWFERAAQAGMPGAADTLARLQDAGAAAPAAMPMPAPRQAGTAGPGAPPAAPVRPGPATLAAELPLALSLARAWEEGRRQLAPAEVQLVARCAQALAGDSAASAADLLRLRSVAAEHGEREAQLALGLFLARMNQEGDRVGPGDGTVNFKRALRWLAKAGEQGVADAWFAMSRIYVRPEFSQRSASDAQACLERAAGMGHSGAQLECGIHAWRGRRAAQQNDVKAVYWLQQAVAQGSAEAQAALDRIAPPPPPAGWASPLLPLLTRELLGTQALLAARIELAALFQLTRAEALLLDVKAADHGHCLVVDIRASYGRARRRLVLVRNAAQRQALDRIVHLFEQVDAQAEGNYRQRLYRFKSWLGAGLMAAA